MQVQNLRSAIAMKTTSVGRGPSVYSSHVFAQYSAVLYGFCRTLDKVTSKECNIGYRVPKLSLVSKPLCLGALGGLT